MNDDNALLSSGGRLRVDLPSRTVHVTPGEPVAITVQIMNASSVIEMVSVGLHGVPMESLDITPSTLKLFPEESIEVTILVTLPASLAAGVHDATVVVAGVSEHVDSAEDTLHLVVPEQCLVTLVAEPPIRTGRGKTVFSLQVDNVGNTPVTAQLRAADADRLLTLTLDRPIRRIEPGGVELVEMRAKGRRPWFGGVVERLITIELEAADATDTADVRFRQRPRITAGVITLFTLALIGLLWALAMLFGVSAALAPTAPTKEVPASFTGGGIGLEDLDPAAVGGTMTGVVTAATTGQPVARVTVEAFDTAGRLAGATATDDEGVFVLESLLPTRYRVRVRAAGFPERWWPDATSEDGATLLAISPTEPLEGIDTTITGAPGSLGGQAIAGDGDQQPITVEVTAIDIVGAPVSQSTATDGSGVWSIAGLPAPATYRVVYRSDGYSPVEVTQPLEAGQPSVLNTVRLPAAQGAISGLVVDRNGTPLGGIEIEAQRGDVVIATTTPTAGEIGTFQLVELQTPATYLLTFTGEGRASETRAVRLGPGESLEGLEIVLPADTGVVEGQVTDSAGRPLGGVTVTVSGGDTRLAAETFTSGQVGGFRLAGVPAPGVYAVTFELAGHVTETVEATLSLDSPRARIAVELTSSLGRVTGIVLDGDDDPIGGTVIEVSDGQTTRTTTTASEPSGQRGRFIIEGLEPGSYTLTARAPDGSTKTVLREVTAGEVTNVVLQIGGAS